MKFFAVVVFLFCSLYSEAQTTNYPRNYVGIYYAFGYYTDYLGDPAIDYYGGIDFNSVGLCAARRLTKNFYAQANAFRADSDQFFADIGLKTNFLVYHKLQPTWTLSLGSRLGYNQSSILYYGYGLDWHFTPHFVLNGIVVTDFSINNQSVRFGTTYKF